MGTNLGRESQRPVGEQQKLIVFPWIQTHYHNVLRVDVRQRIDDVVKECWLPTGGYSDLGENTLADGHTMRRRALIGPPFKLNPGCA